MAMSVVYSNAFGRLVSETRGGVESDYLSDTLGSTIGLMNSGGVMTDRWEYWPFGEVVSRAGTSSTAFTFLGILGYVKDFLDKLFYVRARHLRVDLARWQTQDSLWPKSRAYAYCSQTPTIYVDPSGLSAAMPPLPVSCTGPWNDFVIGICFADGGSAACQYWANQYYNACSYAGIKPPLRHNPIKGPIWTPVHGVGVVPVYPPPDCGDICDWQYHNESWPCFQFNPPQPSGSGISPTTAYGCAWNLLGGNLQCIATAVGRLLLCVSGCPAGAYDPEPVMGPPPEPGSPGTVIFRHGNAPTMG